MYISVVRGHQSIVIYCNLMKECIDNHGFLYGSAHLEEEGNVKGVRE